MGRFWAGWVLLVVSMLAASCGVKRVEGQQGAAGDGSVDATGRGNAGGSAGGSSSNTYITEIRQSTLDKIDLLLVVDNSLSMADKQSLLAQAMPLLVTRLVTPRCVVPCNTADCSAAEQRDGRPTDPPTYADASGQCAAGHPEMPPAKDVHVGVVTSSLGSHGASGPADVCTLPSDDDHGHLVGELRRLSGNYNELGFLAWDPNGSHQPPGDSDAQAFTRKLGNMVQAAGEHGCGYESTLEAWYRFLIDPEPPMSVVLNGTTASVQGVDSVVLAQRKAFLRPDSLVAIVMLTDENDCSIQDEGYGWIVSAAKSMFRSTSQCAQNPNDACCQSCAEATANPGCPALTSDSECAKGQTLAQAADDLNLRCWDQKARFGFDLLYPTTRYSEALRRPTVEQRSDGKLVPNPLFAGAAPRDPGLVFLEGIVGVPWQDLADEPSLTGPGLRYLASYELESMGRWDVILGQRNAGTRDQPVPPTDPFMIEQPDERTAGAVNPITGDKIVPSTSMNPRANAINGHEQVNAGNRDLQYACTFPLATPRVCGDNPDVACDCGADDVAYNRPLCQPPAGGAATTTQSYAKAYPGLRLLQVLKDFKDNAIVASACPKVMDEQNPDYGYNPAVNALVDRMKDDFRAACFSRPLTVRQTGDKVGSVPCVVMEALPDQPAACDCAALGLVSLADQPELASAARQQLELTQECPSTAACNAICVCELPQLEGQDLADCQNNPTPPQVPGFCYVNAVPNETNVGNPALVESCSQDSKRLVRFVGGQPTPGAIVLMQCAGASLNQPAP